jgi:purine-binding chemotaxis protein CheW
MDTSTQYVTFIAGGELFAVEMAPVQEIIRVPQVVRVPLAPSSLLGLANLRGRALPIVDLRQVCGFDADEAHEANRALVLDYGEPLGFVVDRVVSVIAVDPSCLEPVGTITSAIDTDLLSGLLTNVGELGVVMVLDFRTLIAREFAGLAAAQAGAREEQALEALASEQEVVDADEVQLVSFHVDGQQYAIAIDHVQEIVPCPETVVRVPHTGSHVVGVMTLRERVMPLVSLRGLFGMPPAPEGTRERVVVLTMHGLHVGVVTDGVSEVLRISRTDLEPMPRLLARDSGTVDVTRLCRLDGGKRLVSVIEADELFRQDVVQEALHETGTDMAVAHEHGDVDASHGSTGEAQYVVLRLEGDEFGVPIACVQEIVRLPEELVRIPQAPGFVEGVINLRGAVLPVIDLRRRLGLPAVARSDSQRVMVFRLDGTCTGFIVDSVAEVLSIPHRAITKAPRLSSEQGTLLSQMANLEQQQRIVQLIAPEHLLARQDLDGLSELAAA